MVMKKLMLLILFLLLTTNSWAVIITGTGITKEEAINNGLREAVEMCTGTLIYSVSDVNNFQLQKDQIVATSLGYIKNYKIIKTSRIDDLILITMDINVLEGKIEKILRNNIKLITIDDIMKDYRNISHRQEQMRKLVDMLRIIYNRPEYEKYIINYEGYKINRIGLSVVDLNIITRIQINPFYRKVKQEIIDLLEESNCRDSQRIMSNFYIERGKIAFRKDQYVTSEIPGLWVNPIEMKIVINNEFSSSCREFADNLLYNEDPDKLFRIFDIFANPGKYPDVIKFLPEFNQSSEIIPPEGLIHPLKIKIKNINDIDLKNIKVRFEYCGFNKK